ncbi:MAG: ATP synthase F0 subunit B [Acidobacteriia bacterium]|nr:ATP synthase F0 subunit B [Terriglobia bacterium]
MLELNATIVVVMVLFAVLAWAVSRLYLRPVGALLEERRQSTEGALEKAGQSTAKMEETLRRHHQLIQQARQENYKHQEEHRRQALETRQQTVQQGREEYERILAEARREITAQTTHAKEWMAREAATLSRAIVQKLLA